MVFWWPLFSGITCDTGWYVILLSVLLVGIGGGVFMGMVGLTSSLPIGLAGVSKSSSLPSGGRELEIGAVLV